VSASLEIGLYGKLPSHGDFLQRRVPPEFLTPWDDWLQSGIAASRATLANQWDETYLTSPVWRFALSARACGRSAVAGLLAPSVDRVGRFFPLTLMWHLPAHLSPIVYAALAGPWLAPAEQLLVESLTSEEVDFERFDSQVSLLGASLGTLLQGDSQQLEPEDLEQVMRADNVAWHVPTGAFGSVPAALGAMVARNLETAYDPLTVWWTDGSAVMEPSCLIARGLPAAPAFVSLLDGSWGSGLWCSVRTNRPAAALRPMTVPVLHTVESSVSGLRSAGGSDCGTRPYNQDAWLERSEIGLWAVADGLGGLSAGEVASRMVCDVLASLTPSASLESMIEGIRGGLDEVNATLDRASRRPLDPVESASTVVAMTIREGRAAILWAGDSRAYRLRQKCLEQLTVDHSEDTAVTRAVGGAEILDLDLRVEAVQPGDRFLLCSDGLTRALDDSTLCQLLATEKDLTLCARSLLAAASQAQAEDNFTVVVVDVA
jgi:type VI secretion system protein ImpM